MATPASSRWPGAAVAVAAAVVVAVAGAVVAVAAAAVVAASEDAVRAGVFAASAELRRTWLRIFSKVSLAGREQRPGQFMFAHVMFPLTLLAVTDLAAGDPLNVFPFKSTEAACDRANTPFAMNIPCVRPLPSRPTSVLIR